jgi:N-acyl-D-aspartate/D-glutamate deacylase
VADVLITNGTIVDGSGAEAFIGDIAVEGERIQRIERREPGETVDADAGEVIDANGLTVTPGFIDIHSHSDHTLLVDPRAFSPLNQGVTLEVVGNCGFGCFPVVDPKLAKNRIYAYHDVAPITWRSAGEYFDLVDAGHPGINVISLVPNGQLRLSVVGPEGRPATPDEQRSMRQLLEQSLEEGAWGLSTCLESTEEISMSEEEVAGLCRSVADAGGIYATHTRDRVDHAGEAVAEAFRTAEMSGVKLQVSHLIPDSGMKHLEDCLEVVDRSADGTDAAFDMHGRLFGIGYLYAAVPSWVIAGTPDEIEQRLRDSEVRHQIAEYRSGLSALGDWRKIILLDNEVWPEYARKSIAEIAEERQSSPTDTICDLLAATADDVDRLWDLLLTYTEEQQRETFVHPLCVPASDAAALALDGPLANSSFHGAYGWASWFYRYMVRDYKLLTLEQAIHKLSGQPAAILGLKHRGVLREGNYADIAIFDADSFADRETEFEPNKAAVGMRHVFVNGRHAFADGTLNPDRGGRVLRLN